MLNMVCKLITALRPQQHAKPPRLPCGRRRWQLLGAFSLRCPCGSCRCQERQAELHRSLRALLALQDVYAWEKHTWMRMSGSPRRKGPNSGFTSFCKTGAQLSWAGKQTAETKNRDNGKDSNKQRLKESRCVLCVCAHAFEDHSMCAPVCGVCKQTWRRRVLTAARYDRRQL